MNDKQCDICESTENLRYFPLDGYSESDGNKIFFSGGIYFCDDCMAICEICPKCGKPIATQIMETSLKGWHSAAFCECSETDVEKSDRYNREANRYKYQQHKKKIEKYRAMFEKKDDSIKNDINVQINSENIIENLKNNLNKSVIENKELREEIQKDRQKISDLHAIILLLISIIFVILIWHFI